MKKLFSWLTKAFIAGCIAFALLCGFCMLWYNVPVHYENPNGYTEYVWESNNFYSKAVEGFALGRTNNEGLNNLKDYLPGEPVEILLMGSSHMEGFNVAQDECAAAVINTLFEGEKYCYNLGTAGHTLLYCIKNLPDALEYYKPTEYLVIETFSVDFEQADLQALAEGRMAGIPSHTGGIIGLMQQLPYLRLFYTQHFKGGGEAFGDTEKSVPAEEVQDFDYAAALSPVLDIVAEQCRAQGIKPIIVHNTSLLIAEDGSAYVATDMNKLEIFSRVCEEKGIAFVNMTDTYIAEYERSHSLPYGFSNTSPGGGHMNRLGHRLFAEEVCRLIKESEG